MKVRCCVEDAPPAVPTLLVVTHEHDIAHHARRIVHLRDGLVEYDEPVAAPLLADVPEAALGATAGEA